MQANQVGATVDNLTNESAFSITTILPMHGWIGITQNPLTPKKAMTIPGFLKFL